MIRAAAALSCCAMLAGCGDELLPRPLLPYAHEPSCGAMIGCATLHNLGAMVDRPEDLVRARREAPRDSIRRDAVISAYRGGGLPQPTLTPQNGSAQP